MKIIKTGRTWSIINEDLSIIEGGFFSKEVAENALVRHLRDNDVCAHCNKFKAVRGHGMCDSCFDELIGKLK